MNKGFGIIKPCLHLIFAAILDCIRYDFLLLMDVNDWMALSDLLHGCSNKPDQYCYIMTVSDLIVWNNLETSLIISTRVVTSC